MLPKQEGLGMFVQPGLQSEIAWPWYSISCFQIHIYFHAKNKIQQVVLLMCGNWHKLEESQCHLGNTRYLVWEEATSLAWKSPRTRSLGCSSAQPALASNRLARVSAVMLGGCSISQRSRLSLASHMWSTHFWHREYPEGESFQDEQSNASLLPIVQD